MYPIYRFLISVPYLNSLFFFFNDTATTEIYTLSLHDALPICEDRRRLRGNMPLAISCVETARRSSDQNEPADRSEEHTSELQSRDHLVCRLLLEKKNTNTHTRPTTPTETVFPSRRDTTSETHP